MTTPDEPNVAPPEDPTPRTQFRRNLVRVMAVQVLSLLALWLLQHHYLV
jgi:hypothetical protein